MMRTKLDGCIRFWFAVCTIGVLLLSSTAHAQTPRPFRISGAGTAPTGLRTEPGIPSEHLAMGEATHLGRYQGGGALELFAEPGKFGSAMPFTFMAANGDKLVTHYGNTNFGAQTPGTYQIQVLGLTPTGPLVSVVFVAEFVVQPGESTGRFAGATGRWIMEARTAPFILGSTDPLPYVWEGRGSIVMPRR
jgi:hypothetical protein